jgi:HEAT repeats
MFRIFFKIIALVVAFSQFSLGAFKNPESEIKITSLKEEYLQWDNFSSPVGIKLTIEVSHPKGMKVSMVPPQVIMGAFPNNHRSDLYYKNPYVVIKDQNQERRLSVLQGTTILPSNDIDTKFNSESESSIFSYKIYPGTIFKIHDNRAFCLYSKTNSKDKCSDLLPQEPDYNDLGKNLSASWIGISADSTPMIDLSSQLTTAIQKWSLLQSNPKLWQSIHRNFSSKELLKNISYKPNFWKGRQLCYIRPGETRDIALEEMLVNISEIAKKSNKSEAISAEGLASLRLNLKTGDSSAVLMQMEQLRRLGRLATPAIPELINILQTHEALCDEAAQTLAKIGVDSVPYVMPLLQNSNPEIRRRAISTLGMMPKVTQAAVNGIVAHLEDSDPSVRRLAALAMSQQNFSSFTALPILTRMVKHDQLSIKHAASSALGNYSKEAVPILCSALRDENKSVRIAASMSLMRIGANAKSAKPNLQKALSDPDPYVRNYANKALAIIERDQ